MSILYFIKRKIRFLFQNLVRGWNDSQTWNLDAQIARFAIPRLKRFKKLNNGHPPDLTPEGWDSILDDIVYALEASAQFEDDENFDWERVERGLELFGKYFRHLWW